MLWPFSSRILELGANVATSQGQAVVTGAADTKGSWSEFTSSCPMDVGGILVHVEGNSGNAFNNQLLDIGVGAAASETVILSNLLACGKGQHGYYQCFIPLSIPEGERIAVRGQCNQASKNIGVILRLYGAVAGMPKFHRATTYGANTGDSGGVLIDPGATAHTKGAYSQIVASTTYDHKAFLVGFGLFDEATNTYWLVDIAAGAAASETVVVDNLILRRNGNARFPSPVFYHLPLTVEAGTRLAMRCQCDLNTATVRDLDAVLIGLD